MTTYERQPLPDATAHVAAFGQLDDPRLKGHAESGAEIRSEYHLTAAKGEWIALCFNPDLRLLRMEADVAAAVEEYADLPDDPTIGVDLMRVFSGVPNPWIAVVSLAGSLPISGRLPGQRAVAEAKTEAALMRAVEAEWRVRTDLRQTWLQWSATKKRLHAIASFEGSLDAFIERAEKWQQAGELSGREVALLQIERRELAVAGRRLVGQREDQAAKLRELMGLSPAALYIPIPLDWPDAFNVANASKRAAHNPTLRRLRAEYEAAERTVALEIKKQKADLGLGSELESDEGAVGLGLGAEVTLPIFNGNRQAIAAARGERQLRKARYEVALERQATQLARLQRQRQGLRTEITLIEKLQAIILAEIKLADQLLKTGELDAFTVLEAMRKLHASNLELVERHLELAIVNVSLEHLHWPEDTISGEQP